MIKAPAVQIIELSRTFGTFVAVDRVSLTVPEGEIFGFLGANGAGKTTTIRMLCGLLRPSSGTGLVGGYSINKEAEKIKRIIGYMSQKFSLYEDLSTSENLEFFGGVYGLRRNLLAARKIEVMRMLEFTEQQGVLVGSLPVGYKQRLALACAIMHKPRILFLDEPTGGVDPAARRRFWDLIYDLSAEGTTVFVTTHYMDEAEYCRKVAIMHHGQIVVSGSPSELKNQLGLTSMDDVFASVVKPAEEETGQA